jgi:hypothetical protein
VTATDAEFAGAAPQNMWTSNSMFITFDRGVTEVRRLRITG